MTKSQSSRFLQVELLFGFSTSLCWPEPRSAARGCQGQQRSWVCAHRALVQLGGKEGAEGAPLTPAVLNISP